MFDKLLGVTAWIKCFVYNCRHPQNILLAPVLAPKKRQKALLYWVPLVQAIDFEKEIGNLKSGKARQELSVN